MTYIKLLTVLAGFALLTACAGGVTNNIGEININNGETCDTNPYGADCGTEFETERQTIAENCRTDDSGALCDDATTFVCDKDVNDKICDNTPKYVEQREVVVVMEKCTDTKTQEACDDEDRMTACDANEFATDCREQKYIDKRRMTCTGEKASDRCKPTVALICGANGDIFDDFCTGVLNIDTMRTATCQTHGTGAMGDASCDTVIRTDCVANPFMHLGCNSLENQIRTDFCAILPTNRFNVGCIGLNLGGGERTAFCQMPANIFTQEDCAKLGNIGDLRMTFCSATDIFHANCLDGMNGGDNERNLACQTHGTNEGAGGDATCDGGRSDIRVDCVADPFDYTGCDTLGDLKTPFCTTTKIFDDNCLDGMNGGDSARALACQTHGTGAMGDASCDRGRNGIRGACEADPFDHAGCTTLTGDLRMTFCTTTKIFDDNCLDGTNGGDTQRNLACQTHGITESAGGHSTCDGGRSDIRGDCEADPFDYTGCDTLGDLKTPFCTTTKIFDDNCLDGMNGGDSARALACQTHGTGAMGDASCDRGRNGIRGACEADPFDHAGCTTLTGDLRMTFCTTTKIFDESCLDGTNGGDTERVSACQTYGINESLGGHSSCDNGRNGIRGDCTDPFDYDGCDTLTGDLRMTFCTTTKIFDDNCRDGMNGGVMERNSACQTHGTNESLGGHSTCDASEYYGIRGACEANPFEYLGCATLSGGLLTTLCTTTDIFNPSCLDDMNGGKTERDNVCLLNGTNPGAGGHISCSGRAGVLEACRLNPFAHNGCADIPNIRTIYCRGSRLDSIADGSDTPACKVNYADWQGGFTGTLTETTPENTNKFLPNIDPTGRSSLNLNTATFDGRELGGDVNSGVVFYSTGAVDRTSHFAGILAGTNLGKPIETTAGTAQWNGSFLATNMATAADFTLHIDFNSRDIAGIVKNEATADKYYFVKGSYADDGNSGLITGTVRYGTFSATEIDFNRFPKRFPTSASTSGGVLRGIIGQQGAVGVFISGNTLADDDTQTTTTGQSGWAGGFVVNPTARISLTVDYNDWMRGFGVAPPATPATPTRLNQFLNAGTDRLATANGGTAPSALDFDDIHGDNKIDSDSNNGVAWFSVDANPNRYHYAGIFETTDLGVPLTGKTDAKAIWNGQFESSIGSIKTSTAFELEITFGNAGIGTIEAFVERNNQNSPATVFFHLNGNYDALGVITGKVYYGEFSDTTARTQTNVGAAANGVLSGIIGSNGAVGVFTSGTEISPDGVITGGTNINTGYVGGFVASPFAGAVSYRDWVRLASPTPADSPITPSSGNLNQFLTTTGNVLNKGTYTGADENYNFGLLEGDPNDGFSIYEFTESLTTNYFVGISSTTSLGAALPYRQMFNGEAEAEWTGRFMIYEPVPNAAVHEFNLMVDFVMSDISATVAGYSFTDVTFDENGVVSQGIITRAAVSEPFVQEEGSGQLRAIIGQEGAVGVFHSNANSPIIFAGGFVADPTVMEDMTDMPQTESAFKKYYGDSAREAERTLHPDLTTGGTVAFVEIPPAGLDTNGLTFTNTGNFMPLTIKLGVDPAKADVVDGFVIMGARSSSVNFYRAGLLSETDLGAALDNAVTANWTGTAYSSVHVDSANNNVPLSIPLTLTVDFDAGTIKTAGAISYGNAGDMIEIKGLFKGGTKDNGLPVGILGGTVDYDYNRFFSSNDIPLIGLIGADGAIGVFAGPAIGSNVGVVVGGFQATPDP